MADLCKVMEKFGKAIGNATRFRILECLLTGRKTVGELVRALGLSQPAVSQHLKSLKECELVNSERRGQEMIYAVNSGHVLDVLRDLTGEMRKHRAECGAPGNRSDIRSGARPSVKRGGK